jgi:hypothetical protein
MRAISLMGSGVFSQEEVLGGLEKGTLPGLMGQAGSRTQALAPAARQELDLRRFERQQAAQSNESRRRAGIVTRVQTARQGAVEAAAGPALETLSSINRTWNPLAAGGATENAMNTVSGRDSAILQQIANNTKQTPKPTMATTPESGP